MQQMLKRRFFVDKTALRIDKRRPPEQYAPS
jgi:hypothetical protein